MFIYGMKKCNINETYFDNIDNGQKAYWFGFIAADGYINADYSKLCIFVKDVEVLEKFNKDINSDYKISKIVQNDKRTNKTYEEYSLQISNKKFVGGLLKNGMTHEKTDIFVFPEIEENLYPYFIAGLFDGDGSVIITRGKRGVKCSLISTNEILNKIDEILFEKFLIKPNKHIKVTENKKNVYKEHWYKNSEIFLKYIYSGDSKLYLKRKYDIYSKHLYESKTRNRMQPVLQYSIDGIFIKKYKTIKNAAAENGFFEQGIINSYKKNKPYKNFFWVKYDGFGDIKSTIEVPIARNYKILQIEANGNVVGKFFSLRDAEEKTGIKHSNICNCINNKSNSAGGFIWKRITLK